jgi:hypothetical protein
MLSNVHSPWSLLAIHSMRITACFCGFLRSTICKGDAELKPGPQMSTGFGGGALSYPQHGVSAEGASISIPSSKA